MNWAKAVELAGVQVAPLAAVVTNKARKKNDFSFDPREDLTVIR